MHLFVTQKCFWLTTLHETLQVKNGQDLLLLHKLVQKTKKSEIQPRCKWQERNQAKYSTLTKRQRTIRKSFCACENVVRGQMSIRQYDLKVMITLEQSFFSSWLMHVI